MFINRWVLKVRGDDFNKHKHIQTRMLRPSTTVRWRVCQGPGDSRRQQQSLPRMFRSNVTYQRCCTVNCSRSWSAVRHKWCNKSCLRLAPVIIHLLSLQRAYISYVSLYTPHYLYNTLAHFVRSQLISGVSSGGMHSGGFGGYGIGPPPENKKIIFYLKAFLTTLEIIIF